MVDWAANAEAFSTVAVTGFSLILSTVAILSYRRLRNRRALLIASAFLIFAGKGLLLTFVSFQSRGTEPLILPMAGLDLLILLFLYLSMRVR